MWFQIWRVIGKRYWSHWTSINLQVLATEIFKSKKGMSTKIMDDIFNSIKKNDTTFEMVLYYKKQVKTEYNHQV